MTGSDILGALLLGGISLAAAFVALGLSARYLPHLAAAIWPARAPVPASPVPLAATSFSDLRRQYEFRDGYLLSPIDQNDAFVDPATDRSFAFDVLRESLLPLHPDLGARLNALKARGEPFLVTGQFGSDPLSIAGRTDGDRLIVTVGPTHSGDGREMIDSAVLAALRTERSAFRQALDQSPAAMWRVGPDGAITWANEPYFSLLDRARSDDTTRTWPVPALFDIDTAALSDAHAPRRSGITLDDGEAPTVFEVSAHRQQDGTFLCVALDVGRLVDAEQALRSFVQTLSQTFAHLPIGLVVFDRHRELVLFNPALATLTTLDPQFLSNRPTLTAFLDSLRDRQRMPEPKNYKGWRDEIARLEQGAREGRYHEIWTLPDGASFRVIGRPHPDGAVAFMIEDITSEVSLTRRFRGDIAVFQGVLDDMDAAVAAFAADGRLVLCNAAHDVLWPPASGDADTPEDLAQALRLWRAGTAATPIWQDIEAFAAHRSNRRAWSDEVRLLDGTRVQSHISTLPGGAMLVRFEPIAPDAPPPRQREHRALTYEAAEAQSEYVVWRRASGTED